MSEDTTPFDNAIGSKILVSNQSELEMALAAATGGETIVLRAGEYDSIQLNARHFSSTVRIVSEDDDAPATLTGRIMLHEVSNLGIDGLDLVGEEPLPLYQERIRVSFGENIGISNMTLTGVVQNPEIDYRDASLSDELRLEGMPHERGMNIIDSTGVTVDALDMTQLERGVVISGSSDVSVLNSEFHDLRSDGINFVESSNLVIEGNYFHDFSPWPGSDTFGADHPDFIQFFGTPKEGGIDNVVIRDNIMLQGDGDAIQSIFGHAVSEEMEEAPFTNFEISGNFIQNSYVHGVSLGDVADVRIFGNVLIPSGEDMPGFPGGMRPAIRLFERAFSDELRNVEIFDNAITLSWRPEFDPTGWGVEENAARDISYGDNLVLDRGKEIPGYWAELELPDPSDFGDAQTWIAAARDVLGLNAALSLAATSSETEGVRLIGAADGDDLTGGDGDDTLEAIGGATSLTGGDGADRFMLSLQTNADHATIVDLDLAAGDQIEFAGAPLVGETTLIETAGDLIDLVLTDRVSILESQNAALSLSIGEGEETARLDVNFADESLHLCGALSADQVRLSSGESMAIDLLANDAATDVILAGHSASRLGAEVEIIDGMLHYRTGELPEGVHLVTDVITTAVSDGAGGVGFSELEVQIRSAGAVTRQGGDGDDYFATSKSGDVIVGGAGDDRLYARQGDDWLEGGAGNDWLYGCQGSDTLFGGEGRDVFAFFGSQLDNDDHDVILDLNFEDRDMLDLNHFAKSTFDPQVHGVKADGSGVIVRSFEDLTALAGRDGFAIERTDRAGLTLTIDNASGGTSKVEMNFAATTASRLDEFWLFA